MTSYIDGPFTSVRPVSKSGPRSAEGHKKKEVCMLLLLSAATATIRSATLSSQQPTSLQGSRHLLSFLGLCARRQTPPAAAPRLATYHEKTTRSVILSHRCQSAFSPLSACCSASLLLWTYYVVHNYICRPNFCLAPLRFEIKECLPFLLPTY